MRALSLFALCQSNLECEDDYLLGIADVVCKKTYEIQ